MDSDSLPLIMFDDLSESERLLLIKFVCAFAWADLEVSDQERRFVRRLVDKLSLDAEERRQVEQWLDVSPSPADVDPSQIPGEHRRVFIEAVRALIYADGTVDPDERASFERLQKALSD